VKCATGFIHSATVEFYLDWSEGMEGAGEDAFGNVAAGLGLLRKKSRVDQVTTGYRPFPMPFLSLRAEWNTRQSIQDN
jgi:hypothetical protein